MFYGDLYPNDECYNESIAQRLRLLLAARKLHAYGQTQDYFVSRNVLGFVRSGDDTHAGCTVVMSNSTKYLFFIQLPALQLRDMTHIYSVDGQNRSR